MRAGVARSVRNLLFIVASPKPGLWEAPMHNPLIGVPLRFPTRALSRGERDQMGFRHASKDYLPTIQAFNVMLSGPHSYDSLLGDLTYIQGPR